MAEGLSIDGSARRENGKHISVNGRTEPSACNISRWRFAVGVLVCWLTRIDSNEPMETEPPCKSSSRVF